MNKRALVLNCLDGKPYDRTPGSFWYHFPENRWRGQAAADAHLDFYRSTDVDFIKIMDEIRYHYDMRSGGDWRHYRPPRKDAPERMRQYDLIKAVSDRLHAECMVYTTVFDPLRMVGITMGYDFIEAHIREDTEAVAGAFRNMAESMAEYAGACMDAGADGIYFSSKGAEAGRFPPEVFAEVVKAPDLLIAKAIAKQNPYTILHICGFDTEIGRYTDFPFAAVNWDVHHNRIGLREGAALFPGRVLLGGIDNRNGMLVKGTDGEIRAEVRSAVGECPPGARLILGADCTVPSDIGHHRIRTAMGCLREQ